MQESPTKEDVCFEKVLVEAVSRGADAPIRVQPDPLLHVQSCSEQAQGRAHGPEHLQRALGKEFKLRDACSFSENTSSEE